MRKLNKPLLRRLARKLRRLRHEEHYDQGTFAMRTECGTAACIAGQTVIEEGRPLIYYDEGHGRYADYCRGASGRKVEIFGEAKRLLGLSEHQARTLFAGNGEDWPEKYGRRFEEALWGDSKERPSRIAADLLDALADGTVKL